MVRILGEAQKRGGFWTFIGLAAFLMFRDKGKLDLEKVAALACHEARRVRSNSRMVRAMELLPEHKLA